MRNFIGCRNNDKFITYEKFKTFLFKLAERSNKDAAQDEIPKIIDKLQQKLEPGTAGTTVRIYLLSSFHRAISFCSHQPFLHYSTKPIKSIKGTLFHTKNDVP